MQMIFQDHTPNQDKNIGDIESCLWAMKLHGKENDRARELIEMVGLKPVILTYLMELRGRVNRQPGLKPWFGKFIVCDESAISAWMYPSRPRLSIYWRSRR